MHARMIHGRRKGGEIYHESQEYDANGRYIQAADRASLNKRLLDALEKLPNVTLHFNHKLTGADFNKKTAWFEQQGHIKKADHAQNPTQSDAIEHDEKRATEISVTFDLLIGADGAHSATRYHLMKFARLDYQQEYIDTLWCEFHISPRSDSSFAIDPNHLHIWPGGSFMFIAIPSLDKSFTCTLFAPASHFNSVSEKPEQKLVKFFHKNFPGVCPELISASDLQKQFRENPHLPLISIKCKPYHYKSSVVILGDAAHAMVPFYGQGMNAGLEDVRVLFDILDEHNIYDSAVPDHAARNSAREAALDEYTSRRAPDAAAINDLALRNYEEMRSSVQSPLYKMRKWMEESVNVYLPNLGWRTQYTRVSFENQRYSEVDKAVRRQGRILMGVIGLSLVGMGGLTAFALARRDFWKYYGTWLSQFGK
ncbi:MAG: kynurenine 3-monooxygenase, mitochondrial precursor [Alectoria sarmentosa]|nr:MAG: kynurenine 3-monooxygenase, mitochondrial precursor [Alectoria sarmentosa]